jgi:hypothetical protein
MRGAKPRYLADFDSATAMLRALARYLHGRDFPLLGAMPRWAAPAMKLAAGAVNRLPPRLQEQVYIWSGWYEAISPKRLDQVNLEDVAEWVVRLYPERRYPVVAVGSANGAAVHLWAALGIPWLPQTFLVPVARSGIHPDEPQQEMRWAKPWAERVLQRNPTVQLHHMHDPVQDRLMIQRMSYFRFKRLTLGAAYERFLRQRLVPGGTIVLMECHLQWPVTQCGERYLFQFGALGGASLEELQHGGERVSDYLQRYRSHRRRWEPPPPDRMAPEAEWGFEPALREDLERFARRHDYRLQRIIIKEPEQMSPLVADFYRWWNQKRRIPDNRLLGESFIVMEPYWTVRTGSVPFWMVFNKEPSLKALESYLTRTSFDDIFLMLFSHGVESVGLPSIDRWRMPLRQARRKGALVGVDERAFPRDFAVFVRYYFALRRMVRSRHPLPPPVTLKEFSEFFEQAASYGIQWVNS